MQLEAQLRLCQSCLWCCKSGLRLLSQSYAHRWTLCINVLHWFRNTENILKIVFGFCALQIVWFWVLCFVNHRKAVNYYDLLGVKSNASLEEIKNAFFNKSKKVSSYLVKKKIDFRHTRAAFNSLVSTFCPFPQWASWLFVFMLWLPV